MDEQGYRPSEGSCIISEDVIATIASTAALDVAGVAGMASRPADIRGIIGSGAAKSVRVINNENETVLEVYINLKLGARIPEVAGEVQHARQGRGAVDDRQAGQQGQCACFRAGTGR